MTVKRWLMALGIVVLSGGLGGGVIGAQAPGERDAAGAGAPRTRVVAQAGVSAEKTEQAAGSMTLLEPGPAGGQIELDAAVWMGLKQVKGAACFSFEVERTATETTVTAYCFAGQGKGKAWGNFEVALTRWDGNSGTGVDFCEKRQNLKQNPVFTCTVQNPDVQVEPE